MRFTLDVITVLDKVVFTGIIRWEDAANSYVPQSHHFVGEFPSEENPEPLEWLSNMLVRVAEHL